MGEIITTKSCKNNCGQIVSKKSLLKCENCRKNKFWFIDIDLYNINEKDYRKKLKKCECGHYYILWNQYQHTQSKHHKKYIINRDNLEMTIENPARLCTKKDENNRIHGRWSINYNNTCPKCVSNQNENIVIESKNADVYIFHKS
jgi:hypothetical protein